MMTNIRVTYGRNYVEFNLSPYQLVPWCANFLTSEEKGVLHLHVHVTHQGIALPV